MGRPKISSLPCMGFRQFPEVSIDKPFNGSYQLVSSHFQSMDPWNENVSIDDQFNDTPILNELHK